MIYRGPRTTTVPDLDGPSQSCHQGHAVGETSRLRWVGYSDMIYRGPRTTAVPDLHCPPQSCHQGHAVRETSRLRWVGYLELMEKTAPDSSLEMYIYMILLSNVKFIH